ncbi:MAG TPA: tRNA (adenosine(37)-N6)-threonylcarbamoyltransferase complex dimerization subunit type 1 TsaB [Flavipsychrobacter sp.]|nr:tRNA (adenosine(37)-N6)-threonylcarbamoyltransferase complex dimerization subunit type 1 TsaB [Flavipsychrobacter sp.]
MAYILHIDTSGKTGLIALAKDGTLISKRTNETEKDHASAINSYLEAVLSESSVSLQEVDAIAVIGGPGSYTGLRIGLATAKGLCYALEIPLLLSNQLDRMALCEIEKAGNPSGIYVATAVARAGEYFVAVFDSKGQHIVPARHMNATELEDFMDVREEQINLISSDQVEASLLETFWYRTAYKDFREKKLTDTASSVPFYLKEAFTTASKR